MRFKNVSMSMENGYLSVTFTFPFSAKEEIQESLTTVEQFDVAKDYDFSFSKATQKRSLDANSYMWVLCDKIAKVIHSTKNEVYRKAIREVGVYKDTACMEEAVESFVEDWGKIGIGYFAEVFDTKLTALNDGKMKKVRIYFGSSKYSKPEMARLIDYIVEEAKGLDIEVLSEAKIRELEEAYEPN